MHHAVCFSTACSTSRCVCSGTNLCVCVCSRTVSWYLAKSVWFCVSHPVSGKVVRLTDWAVWVPSPRLGCLSVSSSFLLPLSFLPPSHLPVTLLQWYPAGRGIFSLHLPYLASCIGRPSPWITSTHCSITVATIPDGSAAQVCLPRARSQAGSLWQCEVKMPDMTASALCVLALLSSIRARFVAVTGLVRKYTDTVDEEEERATVLQSWTEEGLGHE